MNASFQTLHVCGVVGGVTELQACEASSLEKEEKEERERKRIISN